VLSLTVVYFILAPKNMLIPGLEIGSAGLVLRVLILQLIQVNVIAWFISCKWKFDWLYQFIILGFLIALGMSIKVLVINVLDINVIASILIASFFYIIIVMLAIYIMPWIKN